MKRATRDALGFLLGLAAMPFVLIVPFVVMRVLANIALDAGYFQSNPLLVLLAGLLILVAQYTVIYDVLGRRLERKPIVNWKVVRVVALLGLVAVVLGGVNKVRCAVRTRQQRPEPYEVARNEVYQAFLDDIAGDSLLLVQDDTHPAQGEVSTGYPLGIAPTNKKLQQAADEASQDYGRRDGLMPIDGRFTLSRSYQMVSRSIAKAVEGFREQPEACKPFKEPSTLVFLSPVGFNSDQTFAGIEATVVSVCTGNYGAGGWSGVRMFRKECGKWVPVKSRVFCDSAIDL